MLNARSYSPTSRTSISPVTGQDKSVTPTSSPKPDPVGVGILPFFMANLVERRLLFNFLEASYRGGPSYKYGKDPKGQNVLIEHENERADPTTLIPNPTASEMVNKSEAMLKSGKYQRRLRAASYVNFVKPIQDKIRSYAFSSVPSRPKADGLAETIERISLDENLDAMVSDGLRFMEAWIGFDAKIIVPSQGRRLPTMEEAARQDPEHKGHPYIVRIDPRRVVDFSEQGGDVVRVVIEEDVLTKASFVEPSVLRTFYREWTATEWILYELQTDANGKQKLVRVGGSAHEFGVCPFRRVCFSIPTDDICDLSRQYFNLGSLLDEEMYQNTFSQRVITGSTAEDVAMTDRGAGNTMVLKEPDSKVTIISGDPNQARVIMERMSEVRNSIFSIVSMESSNKNVAESAEKKKRDLESLYTLLNKIVESIEKAENWLLVSMGIYNADDLQQRTRYGRQFDVYSIDDLISQLSEAGKIPFVPSSLKRRLAVSLAQKVDPFGPHEEYEQESERMFDTTSQVVESLMSMKRDGALTPDMLVVALGVPVALAGSLIESMSHPDPSGVDTTDPNAVVGDGEDKESGDEVYPVSSGGKDGVGGGGDSGSGSIQPSDSSPDGSSDAGGNDAKPGKARRVRSRKSGGEVQ